MGYCERAWVVARLGVECGREGHRAQTGVMAVFSGGGCRGGWLRGWGAGLAAVLVLLASAASAHAATYYVTNTTDPTIISPHDGSLREAITQANASSASTNTISISA